MNFRSYVKDKFVTLSLYLLTSLLVWVLLILFDVNIYLVVYIPMLLFISQLVILFLEYIRRANFYKTLKGIEENLDQVYLIHELIERPSFFEGKVLYDVLYNANKVMIENINKYKFQQAEMMEYIEMWTHEIKTPLASSKLIIENQRNITTNSIDNEIDKINYYIEQMLYFSKSEIVEKDYIIKDTDLKSLVNGVIVEFKKDFIYKKITLNLDNLDYVVKTDQKWMHFIISQLISNAIKYLNNEQPTIKISACAYDNGIKLIIQDNGIGISSSDLPRIFEKGFTGDNGHANQTSTGIGLYLCKKLCDKMEQGLEITSTLYKSTTVCILFPISNMYNVVRK